MREAGREGRFDAPRRDEVGERHPPCRHEREVDCALPGRASFGVDPRHQPLHVRRERRHVPEEEEPAFGEGDRRKRGIDPAALRYPCSMPASCRVRTATPA